MLVNKGRVYISQAGRHSAAAQLYMGVEMIREAVDAFADAKEWGKARKVARELEPRCSIIISNTILCTYFVEA